jgi:hypothetical protein
MRCVYPTIISALAAPKVAFAQQQPVAEHAPHGAVILRFHKIVVLRDQHGFDVFGPAQIARRNSQETKKNNISIFPRAFREVGNRVALGLKHAAHERKTFGTGGKIQLEWTSLSNLSILEA